MRMSSVLFHLPLEHAASEKVTLSMMLSARHYTGTSS